MTRSRPPILLLFGNNWLLAVVDLPANKYFECFT
jgi:hypothetical protein